MSSFEWNKIIASVLTAMIVAMVAGILATIIVHPERLEKPAYMPPGAEAEREGADRDRGRGARRARADRPAMAKADPKKGEQVAKVCLQCHTFGKGEPNKIGPNLFGVVPKRTSPACPGYQFSQALVEGQGPEVGPGQAERVAL